MSTLNEKQKKKNLKTNPVTERELLLQGYSRYVSMAHTIFETYFQVIFAIFTATIGIVLSLVEIKVIPWNKYHFISAVLLDIALIILVTFIAVYMWYYSRQKRAAIVRLIKNLDVA
ncbi:hypothetical protein HYU15_03925 [Candidatus Woesearchaeota archaeon]|nr:hypothetical protein [Candidatus Woesearchaeota archaeon]